MLRTARSPAGLILILLVLLAPRGQAQTRVGESWSHIPQSLQDKGIESVGTLNLSKLIEEGKGLRWREVPRIENPPSFAETRRSAYYQIENKTITRAQELPGVTPESLSHLELHEALGALGYPDRHYELSTALDLMNHVKDPKLVRSLRELYGTSVFDRNGRAQSGSGTSVGGGGDLVAITAKGRVLREIMREGRITWDFLRTYPFINFEPQYSRDQQFVAIKYQYRSAQGQKQLGPLEGVRRLGARGDQELISIYVPVLTWLKGESQRQALLREIVTYVTELFPAFDGVVTKTVIPGACDKSVQIRFPEARSLAVRAIQEARQGIGRGCDAMDHAFEIRFPSFRDEERVAVADDAESDSVPSEVPYTCRLGINGGAIRTVHKMPTGDRRSQVSATILANGSIVLGTLVTNARGEIESVLIFNAVKQDKSLNRLQQANATGAKPPVARVRAASGEQLSFSCEKGVRP